MNHHPKLYSAIILSLLCTACVRQATIPLGNDLMEISVSTSAVYRRAGAQEIAVQKAAQATVDAGYDKYIVVQSNGWTEQSISGASYGNLSGNSTNISGQQGSFIDSTRSPEIKMVIRMLHTGDKGAEKAVDARAVLKQQSTN